MSSATNREESVQAWIRTFEELGALWIYDGDPCPENPHALLTSGRHSNGYFNAANVMHHPKVCRLACQGLVNLLIVDSGGTASFNRIGSVCGSAMGAITMAHEIAAGLNISTGYTEKGEDGDGQKVMLAKRFPVESVRTTLVVEDVITSFGTTKMTIAALQNGGAKVEPIVLVLVNRSGQTEFDGFRVMALVERELPTWEPDECPYCQAGSKAIRPKENWDKLTGR